jgi:ABC-2 type transport system ATP-binding protein
MITLDGVTIVAPSGAPILDAVDLHVRGGQVCALVSERSTRLSILIDVLLGFSKQQAGSITVRGSSPGTRATDVKRLIAAIRMPSGLEPRLTVRANIELVIRLAGQGVPRKDIIDAALRESDVPDRRFDRPAAELTLFEERAVWLAIARLRATPVVLCEDPSAQMSEADGAGFAVLVRELASIGPAVLITTADAALARAAADHGGVLEHGRLVFQWSRSNLPTPIPASDTSLGHEW